MNHSALNLVQGELERLYDLEDMMRMSADVLGFDPTIVGGTAITGGVTNPLLVIFGALTVALIPIAAAVIGVPASAQSLVYGVVIIVAAALTMQRDSDAAVK